jgi:hypothetical protein
MFSKIYEPSPQDPTEELIFDYSALPSGLGKEQRLSRLCRLILEVSQLNLVYTLKLPGQPDLKGEGPNHQQRCLTALALFD